jgi:hypothetical protein
MINQDLRRSRKMAKVGKHLPLIVAVLIGLLFQQLFIFWDKAETPSKATMAFAQAYFLLDEHTLMERLCKDTLWDVLNI